MNFKKLTIFHNHGSCVLENGTIAEDGTATGTCTGGGEQSRLMGCVSNKTYPTGVEKSWPLYKRPVRQCTDYANGVSTPIADEYVVDVCVF